MLHERTAHLELAPWLTRWVDPTAQASWDDARQHQAAGDFKPVGALGSAGFSRAAHWYALRLQRAPAAGERWVLAIGAPYLDDVQVWLQQGDGAPAHVQMGDRHLGDGRPLRGRQHALGLTVPATAGDALQVWVRVRSSSVLNVTAELWRPDAYLEEETQTVAAWGVVIGLLLLAALTQLLFGLWLRDRVMGAFALFIGVLCLLYFGTSGMALVMLDRPPAWFNDLVVGAGSLGSVAAGSLLSMQVLDIRRSHPRWRWLYLGPSLLALAMLPSTVTDWYGSVMGPFNLWGMLLALINIGVSLQAWRRLRTPLSLMYAVAAWCIGCGATVTVLALLGALPGTPVTRSAYQASAVVYLVLMLVAMAIRVGTLRHDKLLAQERVEEERRFAAFVAHEFRNPLAGIDRSANVLQLIPDLTPAQTALRLSGIRRHVARMNTLLDSFLQAEAGAQRPLLLQSAPVALRPWLQVLRQELDEDARERLTVATEPADLRARFDAGWSRSRCTT